MQVIMKKYLILVCLLLPLVTIAQNRYRFSGVAVDKTSGEKLEMVTIQIKELTRWTTSGMSGEFAFDNIPQGTYTLQANYLGFQPYEVSFTINKDIDNYKLMLSQLSLSLQEVTVVAKENTSLSSSSKIESTALDHIQPNSLAEVMQLIPGQVTINPDMSKSNQISIRDINTTNDPDDNSAMGTAIIVDGTPVNNDANMQTLNTAGGGTAQGYSTAGQGVDLRQIATDNIESVEVIRGIPSVEYGELTTGAVLVKTKAGKTRLNVKMKADPKIKQTALSKGFLLPGQNNGAMNVDLDYTYSLDNLIEPTKSYRRVTSQLGYSNTYFRSTTPLSVNAKVSYFSTFGNKKNDPDMLLNEIYQSKEESFGFKLFGNWLVKKPWLTNVSYNFSGDFEEQDYYEYKVTSNGGTVPLPTAMVSGVAQGTFLPSSYESELTIDGRPYNYFGVIKGNVTGKYGLVTNNLMVGVEWRTSGNNGQGRIYDMTRPPNGAVSTRPRAFKDIPASKNLALFLEDRVSVPIGKTTLKTQAGLRYNNMLPTGLFSTDGFMSLEPRVNLTYELLRKKNNELFRDLDLRFGYGRTSKTPSMIYLYPDKYYHDENSFNYYPDLLVVTTKVIEGVSNPDLKPMTNTKFETGIDFNIHGVKVMLTGFKENMKNGFSWEDRFYTMEYKLWNALSGIGKSPYFENGEIYYKENGQTLKLPYTTDRKFETYNYPMNSYDINKKGIEYVVNFGRIKSLRSSFSVDGAYYHITRISKSIPYVIKQSYTYQGARYPYLPVYPGNKGNQLQRLNSNFQVITHIPEIKMITTLSAQVIWMDKSVNYWKDGSGKPVYFAKGENNQKLYGQTEGYDKIYVDPIGFYDLNGTYFPWKDNYTFESPYYFMVDEFKSNYYNTISYPVLCQINLKLTKEIGRWAKLSFFANNLFNNRPLVRIPTDGSYTRKNQPAYFGAELKFTL